MSAGAVACLLLAGCAGSVGLDAPRVSGAAARTCQRLVEALPGTVADQERRDVDPGHGYGAAWGDPPIELRCGVPKPAGFTALSACQVVNGVGWFVPEEQITGQARDITMTTVDRSVYVEVRLPADYFPPAGAMANLAAAVKKAVPQSRPCL